MGSSFVKGDLFHYPGLDALAHGCNCAGAMGKGIAVEFRDRFPDMYAEYRKRCLAGTFKLGDVFTWTNGSITVFNLGTQRTWRTGAQLEAIEASVKKMLSQAETMGLTRIGLPRIGSGLGGLPWNSVRTLLCRLGQASNTELVIFEEFVPS